MTEIEKLRIDAEGLLESIKLDWKALAEKQLSPEQRQGIRTHIEWAQQELSGLLNDLDGSY